MNESDEHTSRVDATRAAMGATYPLSQYVARSPTATAVVAGVAHRVVSANAAFDQVVASLCGDDGAAAAVARRRPAARLVGRSIAEILPPDSAQAACALLDRVRLSGTASVEIVAAPRRAPGRHWHCTAWPIDHGASDEPGPLVLEVRAAQAVEFELAQQRLVAQRALIGALHEQDLAEAAAVARTAAERGEAELAAVFESMPDAVYIATAQGIRRANHAALAQFGVATVGAFAEHDAWREGPAMAVPLRVPATGAPLAATDHPLVRALGGATAVSDVLLHDHGAGEDRLVRCAAAPVVVGGEVVAAVVVHTDVTDRQRLEARLRRAQKMEALGQLAGGVAHDFNNLLTVIVGNLEFVRADLPSDHPTRPDLREIAHAAEQAQSLIRQLLVFSRQPSLRPTRVRIGTLLSGAERLLRRLIGEEIVLQVNVVTPDAVVQADPGQLEQVLVNLAVNARDAMLTPRHGHPGGGGVLEIAVDEVAAEGPDRTAQETSTQRRWVRLQVRDTGHGMDAATQAHLFEPFFTTKPVGRGTGLGLSTVYGIVQHAGGTIELESAPNRGATFTILLPADPVVMPPESGARAARATAPPAGMTVLLVEDEASVRLAMRRLLERRGHTVMEARHGADALVLWREHRASIDAVITDVRMPELGGRELLALLRRDAPTLPVVLISGYADQDILIQGPYEAFVEKPFAADALFAALHQVLAAASRSD